MSDLSKVHHDDSEGIRFGQLMAECYYYMGKHIFEALGEEKGSEVIRAALKEFGEYRVACIREEAAEKGIAVTDFEQFFKVRDMPDCGWINGSERGVVKQCLFDEVWQKYGELGRKLQCLYCEIDYVLYGGFGFHLERPKCKGWGDDECVMHFTYENVEK